MFCMIRPSFCWIGLLPSVTENFVSSSVDARKIKVIFFHGLEGRARDTKRLLHQTVANMLLIADPLLFQSGDVVILDRERIPDGS